MAPLNSNAAWWFFVFFLHASFHRCSPGLWYGGEQFPPWSGTILPLCQTAKRKLRSVLAACNIWCSFSSCVLYWSEHTMPAPVIVWRAEERAAKWDNLQQQEEIVTSLSKVEETLPVSAAPAGSHLCILSCWVFDAVGTWEAFAVARSMLACFQTPHVCIKAVHTSNIVQKNCFRPYVNTATLCCMGAWKKRFY